MDEDQEEDEEGDEDYYSEEAQEKGNEFDLSPSFILENDGENVFNPLCYFAALIREAHNQRLEEAKTAKQPVERKDSGF